MAANGYCCQPPALQLPHSMLTWSAAQEATEAIKPVLGKYYNHDSRNVFAAMWQDWPVCCYVAPDAKGGDVLWFRR